MSRRTVVCLLVLCVPLAGLAAACGSAGQAEGRPAARLPRSLAETWAAQAEAVAGALGSGSGCRARALAAALRDEVIAAEARLPGPLRAPLLEGVNALANRIACLVPPRTVTVQPPRPGKGPAPPPPPGQGRHKGWKKEGHG